MERLPTPLIALIALSSLSGCIGDAASDGLADAAAGQAAATDPTVRDTLYSMEEIISGMSATDGGEPARVDTFELPVGSSALLVEAEFYTGTGDGRIDVVDPDGRVVFRSGTITLVGTPAGSVGATREPSESNLGGPVVAGIYEVRYHLTGSMEAVVHVSANVPAAPAGAAA